MIYYIRNEVDNLIGFKYNNKLYYCSKNLQNDIIGILDSNYNLIVNYKYDSWGNIISITDSNGTPIMDSNHIGIINPFRYRSYYYDTETNLYYLNSRYYSPVLKRFFNVDCILGANQDIMSFNLYTYCGNNPIINIDMAGNFLTNIIDNIKSYASSVAKAVKNKASVYDPATFSTKNYCKNFKPKKKKKKTQGVLERGFGLGGLSASGEILGLDIGVKNSQFLMRAVENGKEVCYRRKTQGFGIVFLVMKKKNERIMIVILRNFCMRKVLIPILYLM